MQNRNKQQMQPSGQPKKPMVVRILILAVAALMFIGAIAIPFMGIFSNR